MTSETKAVKAKRMTARRALEVISDEMKCWCSEYNEETGEQCRNAPTVTIENFKFDTSSNWCAEHSPGKQHYADKISDFEGGLALEFVRKALAKVSAKKRRK